MLQHMGKNAVLHMAARIATPIWIVLSICHVALVQAPEPQHADGTEKLYHQDTANTACVYMYVHNCSACGDANSCLKHGCSAHFLSFSAVTAFHHWTWALLL